MSFSDAEYLSADFDGKDIQIPIPEHDKTIRVLGIKIYATMVEWRITHENIDWINNLPGADVDADAFHKGFSLQLEWLSAYDRLLDGSELVLSDGASIRLTPSNAAPNENGAVTLTSILSSTVDLRRVIGIRVLGREIEITNPMAA